MPELSQQHPERPARADGSSDLRIAMRTEPDGSTRVDLMAGERSVSWLWVIPLTIRVGEATVRMDGIGGVGTEEACRKRGYSRRVLEATVDWMRQGSAALSMLYGIPDFYPKFGYATAGPDHRIELTNLSEPAPLPAGWRVRPWVTTDLPVIRRLYEQGTANGVGAAVRAPTAGCWSRLATPNPERPDECRLIEGPDGQTHAYAWRARWHWYVNMLESDQAPNPLALGEVMADGPASADAVLAACRAWAVEESAGRPEPIDRLLLALPPEGPVAAAARHQSSRFAQRYQRCGGSMARVLDVARLLEALRPELTRRLQTAGTRFEGTLLLRTDLGDAVLRLTPEGVTVESAGDRQRADGTMELRLPQTALARLALGAFPPDDLLDRLEQPVDEEARRLLRALFPLRHPHMSLPDRY